jgi:predicted Zn finger-like uncharacterized protein
MAIAVTCPSCHTRFNVSEKFAGKKGPCPKCKTTITIPSAKEQIKIHEREHEGTRGASGQLVLKPIEREKVKFRPVMIALGLLPVLAVVIGAWILGTGDGTPEATQLRMILAGLGAAALGPPLAIGGYSFLRNDELEPYRGTSLLVRGLICGLLYAALWLVYLFIPQDYYRSPEQTYDMFMTAMVIVPFLAAGAGIGYATLDLDFGSGFFQYLLYFVACIGCRWLLGWPII